MQANGIGMIVLCINCQNFNLQAAGRDWAVIGFGQCEITPKYAYKSARYARECSSFDAAPDGVAEKRREWLEARVDNVEHDRRPAASSLGVRVDGPVGPHTQED